LLGVFLII